MTTALTTTPVQGTPAVAARRHVRLLVGAIVVAVAALPSLVLDASLPALLVVAAGIVALGAATAVHVAHRRRAQSWAHQATTGVLEAATGAGALHAWVEDVEATRGAHVVLNPAGVFVVESSWHGVGLSSSALRRSAATAYADAARTRSVVRGCGVGAGVRPVVAVWGAGAADLPAGGTTTGDVLFISGAELGGFLGWSAEFGGAWSYAEASDCLLALRELPAADRVLAGAR